MNDKQLFTIADNINEIYQINPNLQKYNIQSAPRIVFVGTQSSGKTTLVNRMIGFEIMPVGDNMVTRTPINVRLHTTNNNSIELTISTIEHGVVIDFFKTTLQNENKNEKIEEFKKKISECTDKITINKYSVSSTPIFIDIYSNKIANFSFVDLPGQVAIACIDKGQSETLTKEIETLITEQISIPNTIVLTIIQSKTDLETDIGLALIKNVQKKIKMFTTIGVITKPDLLDNLERLNEIIIGNISKSVMLDDGYFIVNNKVDSIQKENEYFAHKFDQSKEIIIQKRYGLQNLMIHLKKYLIQMIKKCLPIAKLNLLDILITQKKRALQLGTELKDNQSKLNYFNKITCQMTNEFINSLESKGSICDVGSKIGKILDIFITNITNLTPFTKENIKDDQIEYIINGFAGYHLTTQVSIEQLTNRCISDRKNRPVMKICPIATECIDQIFFILTDTINKIIKNGYIDNLEAFPKLKTLVVNLLTLEIKTYCTEVTNGIIKYLEIEEGFFWSTNTEFKNSLKSLYLPKELSKESKSTYGYDVEQVRTVASDYYKTIVSRSRDYIIKYIIVNIIHKIENNISNELTKLFSSHEIISKTPDLFSEDNEISKERLIIANNITKIENVLSLINNINLD